jgi:hypothetical protein
VISTLDGETGICSNVPRRCELLTGQRASRLEEPSARGCRFPAALMERIGGDKRSRQRRVRFGDLLQAGDGLGVGPASLLLAGQANEAEVTGFGGKDLNPRIDCVQINAIALEERGVAT